MNKVALRSGLTQGRLQELLKYEPRTGVFSWIVWGRGIATTPKVAGTINSEGYRRIQVDGELYQASHLAWLYMTGSHPVDQIDHKNCNTSDDSFDNLRQATQSMNKGNSRVYKTNSLGIKGVRLHVNGQYEARIRINKKLLYLGCFRTPTEAKAAYDQAANDSFGDFARL